MSCKWHFSDCELTIKKGDLVVVLDKSDKDRWKGVVHEKKGFFPCKIFNEILNSSASSPQSLSDEATAKEPVIVNQPTTTTASGAAEVPTLREVAEGKDDRDEAAISSHPIDELKVLDFAEGKDNLDQPTTDSHTTDVPMELAQSNVDQGQVKTGSCATEGSTLLKLAEAKNDVTTEVTSVSSDKTGNLHDLGGLLAVTG